MMYAQMDITIRPNQPLPYRALMIRSIAFPATSVEMRMICRVAGTQCAQTGGRKYVSGALLEYALCLVSREQVATQRCGKQLVGAQSRVVFPSLPFNIDDIEE